LKVHFVQPNGRYVAAAAAAGMTLMEAAVSYGVEGIDALCGGACACATCHVYVDPQWLPLVGVPGIGEADLLEATDFPQSNSRLACQIRLSDEFDEMTVRVAPRLDQ
jgi:ferredoxin, 2Fe-2S